MAITKVTTDVIDMSGNTGGLVWAKGATGDQPLPVDSTAGDLRENTTTGKTEVFNGTEWRNLKEGITTFTVDFLVVAGGGSGGADGPGGGGAGGYLTTSTYGGTESSLTLSLGVDYTITVGPGGAPQAVSGVVGNTGGDSIISGTGITTITVKGGGGGGSYGGSAAATDGGSGGGGANSAGGGSNAGGLALNSGAQGNNGGNGYFSSGYYGGGGGGGAGAVGTVGSGTFGGNGGSGLTNAITVASGTGPYYAGGGGGGGYNNLGTPGAGGSGGGGAGSSTSNGVNGSSNTGGGGGGTAIVGGTSSGAGGSGIVILRYPTANVSSYAVTGTLDTTTDTAYPVANTAYYKLNGDALDSSGNGYNGTASNVTYAAGRFGQAAVFNGSSSKINTGVTNAFDLQTFSVSAWINLNNSSSQTFVCNFGTDSQPNGLGWTFRINGSGQLNFADAYGAGISGSVLATNTWIHVVSVCNVSTGEQTIYLNSQQDATRNNYSGIAYVAGGFPAGSRRLTIGELGGNNVSWLNGSIDQVRIFSSALTAANVTSLYNEGTVVESTEGTDSILQFIGGTGTVTFS